MEPPGFKVRKVERNPGEKPFTGRLTGPEMLGDQR